MVIVAVVVTWNPDAETLEALLRAVHPQVDHTLVIDNASSERLVVPSLERLSLIRCPVNNGLAHAYNLARERARELQASHLLLFDQDSCPAADMVHQLQQALASQADQGQVAAAGPDYKDVKGQSRSPFVALSGLGLKRVPCGDGECVEVDHLISSGSLISLSAFDEIGPFEEQLFIDYVDTEWCWRARRKGYRLLGVSDAHMSHRMGDDEFSVLGRRFVLHEPYRLYYQTRNRCWMLRRPWVGWRWRIMDTVRGAKIFVVIALFSPHRWPRIKYMTKGIIDGVFSKMDRLDR